MLFCTMLLFIVSTVLFLSVPSVCNCNQSQQFFDTTYPEIEITLTEEDFRNGAQLQDDTDERTFAASMFENDSDLFEGDIDVPGLAADNVEAFVSTGLAPQASNDTVDEQRDEESTHREKFSQWPQGFIPYSFSSHYNKHARARIARAMDDIQQVSCVRFVPRKDHVDAVHIFNNGSCSSYVGRKGGIQFISLDADCVSSVASIVHQLLHTVGLFHEQSRVDRDEHVEVLWENIEADSRDNFKRYNQSLDYVQTDYDYSSVMHFPLWAFSRNGKNTLRPINSDNGSLANNTLLSATDVDKINQLYKCKEVDLTCAQVAAGAPALQHGSTCYIFNIGNPVIYSKAAVSCDQLYSFRSAHGNLVQARLAHFISHRQIAIARGALKRIGVKDGEYWTGLTKTDDGNWQWTNGSNNDDIPWDKGQPDNTNNEEHCGGLRSWAALNDLPCDWELNYICQVPVAHNTQTPLAIHGLPAMHTRCSTWEYPSIQLDDKCLMFVLTANNTVTFAEAQNSCYDFSYTDHRGIRLDGNLMHVTDEDEAAVVRGVLAQLNATAPAVWVGLHSHQVDEQLRWHWLGADDTLTTRQARKKLPWDKGEPNNAEGNEHCVELRLLGGLNDVSCASQRPYVCQTHISD